MHGSLVVIASKQVCHNEGRLCDKWMWSDFRIPLFTYHTPLFVCIIEDNQNALPLYNILFECGVTRYTSLGHTSCVLISFMLHNVQFQKK